MGKRIDAADAVIRFNGGVTKGFEPHVVGRCRLSLKPKLNAPGTERLKLACQELLSNFGFKFNLRRYNMGTRTTVRLANTQHLGFFESEDEAGGYRSRTPHSTDVESPPLSSRLCLSIRPDGISLVLVQPVSRLGAYLRSATHIHRHVADWSRVTTGYPVNLLRSRYECLFSMTVPPGASAAYHHKP